MKRPKTLRCPKCVGKIHKHLCATCKTAVAANRKKSGGSASRGSKEWNYGFTLQEIKKARGYE